ncbi:MAG TPA: hypothetical protein VH561_20495 [Micromonosporaceae bacterium]
MGDYVMIDDDPGNIGITGARLAALAQAFKAQAQAAQADINAIEAERPWGDDSFGRGFQHDYLDPVNPGDTPVRDSIMTEMSDAGDQLIKLGNTTAWGMAEFEGGETQNAVDIRSAGLDA